MKLLLLLVFVANHPWCWSECDISEGRRIICGGNRPKCQMFGSPAGIEIHAKRAADKAGVVFEAVIESYSVTYGILKLSF